MLVIPGLGPVLAAGPIVALLTGVGAGGVAGGLLGALIGLGIPEYEAKRYEGRLRKGGILLSVHCDDSHWASRAKALLARTGAEDISSSSEAKAQFAKDERPLSRARPETTLGETPARTSEIDPEERRRTRTAPGGTSDEPL
jgi:hypothetical protein